MSCLRGLDQVVHVGNSNTKGGGGFRAGTILWEKFRFSVRCRNFFSTKNFFAQFGAVLALCASSVAAVARYRCAVVGSQCVCHVRSPSLLGSEKLVAVEKPFNSGEATRCESHRQTQLPPLFFLNLNTQHTTYKTIFIPCLQTVIVGHTLHILDRQF